MLSRVAVTADSVDLTAPESPVDTRAGSVTTAELCTVWLPKSGIERESGEVGDQVQADESDRDDHHDRLHHRDVTRLHRLHQQAAQPREGKDVLDDHDASDQLGQGERSDGYERDAGV